MGGSREEDVRKTPGSDEAAWRKHSEIDAGCALHTAFRGASIINSLTLFSPLALYVKTASHAPQNLLSKQTTTINNNKQQDKLLFIQKGGEFKANCEHFIWKCGSKRQETGAKNSCYNKNKENRS